MADVDIQARGREEILVTDDVLAGGASIVSAVMDCGHGTRLLGAVAANVAGTLYIGHSVDGVTVNYETSQAVAAGVAAEIDEPVLLRYCRVRYVNGVTIQTSFNLSTYLSV